MNSSSNTNRSSKYNLPKFRISSADTNINNNGERDRDSSRNSTRTISSSIISTPSNRRRINNKIINKNINSKVSQDKLIKSKILNLQQSKIKFNLYQDWDINNSKGNDYDYSIFASYPNSSKTPRIIKQSQINAWESAEHVTRNLIFNESDDDDDEEDDDEDEDDEEEEEEDEDEENEFDDNDDEEQEAGENIENERGLQKYNEEHQQTKEFDLLNVIKSIPGYSQGELHIILNGFKNRISLKQEKTQLFDYKYNLQINQQKLFNQSSSFQLKRQVQISQKKFLLRSLFGYSNNLNINYITNNTNYSSIDNSINIQKTFHEDKEEINLLLFQKSQFDKSLHEINQDFVNNKRKLTKNNITKIVDNNQLLKLNSSGSKVLLNYYHDYLNRVNIDEDTPELQNDELSQLLLSQIRYNVRNDD